MTDPYTILGVPVTAADAEIRGRFLALTREFPPEQHPEKFAAVRAAYEKIKDFDARVRLRLFADGRDADIDAVIEEVACRTPRRRVSLKALLAAAKTPPV